eukprot:TRINITY_DN16399_c0_g1_i1.p1 TRINITY_DN16399_c0_g1~~TRINITY_DN16399_c0_g1_i1.p1  ORF type:complete len:339 (+),score=57.05 TRINITY_DN16399_c0_g1_i1:149-1165(+)
MATTSSSSSSSSSRSTPPNIVFGSFPFSTLSVTSDDELPTAQEYLDVFKKYGHNHVDSARNYGNAEEILGRLGYEDQHLIVDTKIAGMGNKDSHSAHNVEESLKESLSKLKTKKVHTLYLHVPDRSTPFEVTLRVLNEAHKEGKFVRLGLSNYKCEEVEEILAICDKNGWVRPTVYQGNYNLLTRNNETSLFPLLRKEGISFYAYSPLAGGFLIGKVTNQNKDSRVDDGTGRFTTSNGPGQLYISYYFKDSYFDALDKYLALAKENNMTNTELGLRWIAYHSILSGEFGDSVIVGASRASQLEANLAELKKGPLPHEVAQALDRLWDTVKQDAPAYHL